MDQKIKNFGVMFMFITARADSTISASDKEANASTSNVQIRSNLQVLYINYQLKKYNKKSRSNYIMYYLIVIMWYIPCMYGYKQYGLYTSIKGLTWADKVLVHL